MCRRQPQRQLDDPREHEQTDGEMVGPILKKLMGSEHVASDKMSDDGTNSWVLSTPGLRRLTHELAFILSHSPLATS
jgi:hypothetical protein